LVFAAVRPYRLPEAVAAVPGAGAVLALGLVSWHAVGQELVVLSPTVGFLAAVLVVAHLADDAGVFRYAGSVAARWSGGSPRRLLTVVFMIASVVTATLSLDATVVLLTPVVLETATAVRARPKPHLYACSHLANSASLLLPVSNLTNLLAFRASGLTFTRFAGVMALPWLAVVGTEYLIFRRFFANDLASAGHDRETVPSLPAPRFAVGVLAGMLIGFAFAERIGLHPAWVAASGAVVLAAGPLRRQPGAELGRLLRAANLPFCAFVFGLGTVVLAVRSGGIGTFVGHLVPANGDLLGLLSVAVLAAVLANVLNNLPATLMLVPLVAHSPALVLAVLVGANVGPNLTYVGSLATLLWRQILHARDLAPSTREFLRLGVLSVAPGLLVGVAMLWLGLQVSGVR
jgi:arsenical pump membrane protein